MSKKSKTKQAPTNKVTDRSQSPEETAAMPADSSTEIAIVATEEASKPPVETPAEQPANGLPVYLQGQRRDGKASKAPHLTCIITGASRYTNNDYLQNKADNFGVSVEQICAHYAAKNIIKDLRAGKSVEDIRKGVKDETLASLRPTSDFTPEFVAEIIRLNSKRKKATPTAPAAPTEQAEAK